MAIVDPADGAPPKALETSLAFGAVECADVDHLLPRQQSVACRLIRSIHQIGSEEAKYEESFARPSDPTRGYRSEPISARDYAWSVEAREPIFAYLIDGPRGSGKTTLLRTARYLLEQTGGLPFNRKSGLRGQFEKLGLAGLDAVDVLGKRRTLLHALPLLRPDHMEPGEAIMEAIFSQMSLRLKAVAADGGESDGRSRAARELDDELSGEVAKGWYFSRSLGVEALLNDSLNFRDYIERRVREAVSSHERGRAWRHFVVKYLNFFDSELLGLFVDDTDVLPHHTVDLLHSIRMFCCHPRIVSVIAGNLHSMRQRLLMDSMARLSKTTPALRSSSSYTAAFWRSFERESIEEYLEKVFPRPNRHFLSVQRDDVKQILKQAKSSEGLSFSAFCSAQMALRLSRFLEFRRETQHGSSDDRRKPPRSRTDPGAGDRGVENYLALWLLKNHYNDSLTPRSARHLSQFKSMVEADAAGGPDNGRGRRVVVAAFTEPQNHPILQRQTDRDAKAIDWVNNLNVRARWRGARQVALNDLVLTKDMAAYSYLLFRLDLEMAKPHYAQQNAQFSRALLPVPAGNNVSGPEVWQTEDRSRQERAIRVAGLMPRENVLRLRQELYGVARGVSSPVVPANCLYFKDLRGIPDVAWWPGSEEPDTGAVWGAFPIGNVERLFRLDRHDSRNAYFQQVVLVLGTFPLLAPIPANEFTNQKHHLLQYELCTLPKGAFEPNWYVDNVGVWKTGEEWKAIEAATLGEPFFLAVRTALADRYKVAVSSLGLGQISSSRELPRYFRAEDIAKELRRVIGTLPRGADGTSRRYGKAHFERAARMFISHIVPRYHRIVCDVRRANLALRVLEQDIIDYAGAEDGTGSPKVPFTLSQNDRYRLVGLSKLRAVLGLSLVSHERGGASKRLDADDRYFKPLTARTGTQAEDAPAEGARDDNRKVRAPWLEMLEVDDAGGTEKARLCWKAGDRVVRRELPLHGRPTDHFLSQLYGCFASRQELDSMLEQFLDTRNGEHHQVANSLRSLLLFFWGIGPCLSSLIHLELMGEWYSWHYDTGLAKEDDDAVHCKQSMSAIAENWKFTLNYATAVICLFACATELNIDRQLQWQQRGESGVDDHQFSPLPDFAISTLGLRLYKNKTSEARAGSFDGVIGDTLLRLQLALGYLGEMESWIRALPETSRQDV